MRLAKQQPWQYEFCTSLTIKKYYILFVAHRMRLAKQQPWQYEFCTSLTIKKKL
jgi:hypothetical protein